MLRILFIKKGKNTKTNNVKALSNGKIIFKIVKLKVLLMVVPLINGGELPTLTLFQINNQQL